MHIIEPGYVITPLGDVENMVKSMTTTWEKTSLEVKAEYGSEYLARCECTLANKKLNG